MENLNLDTKEGMADAVRWFLSLTFMINEGGKWAVPRSNSIYKIEHSTETITRLGGLGDEDSIRRVAEAAGWTYKENKSADTNV